MKPLARYAALSVAYVLPFLVAVHPGSAAEHTKEIAMQVAKGAFDVTITPESEPDQAEGSTLGRMKLEKRFQGDLEASGHGQMLTAMTDVKGSAVYVAIERVTGTLRGRRGSFALAHKGTMARGAQELTVEVVPDSGSGELKGLSGSMKILIAEGKHSYELAYRLTP
jgi:hypothetical protein